MSKKLSELSQDLMQDEGKVHLIYASMELVKQYYQMNSRS